MTRKTGFSWTLLFVASFGAVAAQAADPSITISTGKSGGGYNTIGERLKSVLAEQELPAQVLEDIRHRMCLIDQAASSFLDRISAQAK